MADSSGWIRSSVVGGLVGVFAGGLVVFLVETAGHALFGTVSPADPSAITFPMFAAVFVAWIVGSAAGAAVATYWARSTSVVLGVVVGLVLLAAAGTNMIAFPHPMWMVVGAIVLMPLAAVAAAGVVAKMSDGPGAAGA